MPSYFFAVHCGCVADIGHVPYTVCSFKDLNVLFFLTKLYYHVIVCFVFFNYQYNVKTSFKKCIVFGKECLAQ